VAVPEPEARSSDTPIRRRARLAAHPGLSIGPIARHDGRRAVDRVRLALFAYEQRAQSRAAVLAMWRSRAQTA
jgi:hypothetical protein